MSRETYEALDAAIRAHTADETEGDYTTDWIVCVAAVHAAEADSTNYGYTAFGGYQQGVPLHRLIGLLDLIREEVVDDG